MLSMRRLFFALAGLTLATTPGVEELHRAALAGDLKQVELLIAGGTPVNGRNSLGATPLHDAAWAGEAEIVDTFKDKASSKGAYVVWSPTSNATAQPSRIKLRRNKNSVKTPRFRRSRRA